MGLPPSSALGTWGSHKQKLNCGTQFPSQKFDDTREVVNYRVACPKSLDPVTQTQGRPLVWREEILEGQTLGTRKMESSDTER